MIRLDEIIGRLEEPEDAAAAKSRQYQEELFARYISAPGRQPKARQELREAYKAGAALYGPDGLRRKLAAIDLEYFGRAYLPHYFTRPSPSFHAELDAVWTGGVLKDLVPDTREQAQRVNTLPGCRRAIEAPRGHAKSTNLTLKDALHAALYGYKHYIIILSDSSEQAEGFLADAKTEIEDNGVIREDFGPLEGAAWKSNVILLANGTKIEAIGSGKKIRGRRHKQWRPDLIICDDLENDENVNTPEQRRKLADWYNKAVSKAGDTYTDIVYIGTLLHYDSLLAKVAKNPQYKAIKYRGVISWAQRADLWQVWEAIYCDLSNDNHQADARAYYEAHEAEMLEGTAVLWPDKLSYYDLMVIKVSEGDASFNSEIQNDPIDPDNCVFSPEWLDYWDDEGKQQPDFSDPRYILIAANDPSLGKTKKSDTSAIIVLAKDTLTGYLYILAADIARRKPDVIISDVIEISRKLRLDYGKGLYKLGVETVQFQYFFKEVLAKTSLKAGEMLPIEEINSVQNKQLRILSLQPLIKNGYIKFSRRHKTLIQQLTEYPMGRNDDGPDALQMAVELAQSIKGTGKTHYQSVAHRGLRFRRGAY